MRLDPRGLLDRLVAPLRALPVARAVESRVAPALGWLHDHFERAADEAEGAVHEVVDRLELTVRGKPQGPFPDMRSLQARFPAAGLPDRLMGTTIDNALLHQPGVSPDALMAKARAMGMNTVRLGAYWDEIQPEGPGEGRFERLDELLDAAERHGLKVVLSVGAKAPNWPEYHVPAWATPAGGADASQDSRFRANATAFVARVASHVAAHPAIAMWQVENEPFDPSGPDALRLGPAMVADEIAALREADGGRRPVLINCWSAGDRRDEIDQAFALADLVGLDVYSDNPGGFGAFARTTGTPAYALAQAKKTGKPAMIAELQADDWGPFKATGESVTALTHQLTALGYRDILFWRLNQNLANEAQGDRALTDAEAALIREAMGR